ncbi:hypothetical protein KAR04_01825, partial [Candidatus Calescamantes bacterium]|nr:hypothetical protein [Candidatus Calescamantes bacterium]
DWIEIQNIGPTDVILNETYVLELSYGNTVALLSASETITLAVDDIVVIHFCPGVNDQLINENNPDYWDIYLGTAYNLSAQYQVISLKEDASTYQDVVYYASSDNTYSDALLTAVVIDGEWDYTSRPVYYYVGNGLQRVNATDGNTAFDWKTISTNDLTPGKEDFVDVSTLAVELCQNYPNPLDLKKAPYTTLKYYLPLAVEILELKIYTISGDIIKTVINEDHLSYAALITPGYHEVTWIGDNDQGNEVQTGNFLIGLNADGKKGVKKMTFIR